MINKFDIIPIYHVLFVIYAIFNIFLRYIISLPLENIVIPIALVTPFNSSFVLKMVDCFKIFANQ